ncbi:MAG: FmdB family zinc ribbon protein [bacterium]
MPTYEYQCQACKHNFSCVMTLNEHEKGKAECPKCKSKELKQLVSPFSAKTSRKS